MNWHLVLRYENKVQNICNSPLSMSLPLFVPFCENGPDLSIQYLHGENVCPYDSKSLFVFIAMNMMPDTFM